MSTGNGSFCEFRKNFLAFHSWLVLVSFRFVAFCSFVSIGVPVIQRASSSLGTLLDSKV